MENFYDFRYGVRAFPTGSSHAPEGGRVKVKSFRNVEASGSRARLSGRVTWPKTPTH